MACLTFLEPLVLKNAVQQRCTRTAEEARNSTPQRTQQCDVNTITQSHRFSSSSSQSLVTQELECISKMQIHVIIFICFRQKFWKVAFVFYSLLRIYGSGFFWWTFYSCVLQGNFWIRTMRGCQLQSFPVLTTSVCTVLLAEEKHHKWSITADWETQTFNTSVFCSTQLPAYTWANPGISSWGLYTHFPL